MTYPCIFIIHVTNRNAYKTIFSRMTAVNEEINPEEYKKIEQVFNDIGIAIKSSADTIRPISDVFDDLAKKWETLNSVQKNNIAQEAAGIRQKNIFLATMEHYDDVLTNTEQATNSLGIAQSKQNIYMESLQAHLNMFKSSLEGLYATLSSTGTLKGIVDIATSATTGFTKFASVVGGIPALITLATIAVALFSTKLDGIIGRFYTLQQLNKEGLMATFSIGGLNAVIPALDKIIASQDKIKKAFQTGKSTPLIPAFDVSFVNTANAINNAMDRIAPTMTKVFDGATNVRLAIGKIVAHPITALGNAASLAKGGIFSLVAALKSLELGAIGAKIASVALQATLSLGISVAFSLAFGWIMKYVDGLINAKQKQQEYFNELKNSVSTLTSEINESQKLISTYETLSAKTNLNTEEKEKLATTTEKLSSLYPISISGIDAEGKAISLSTDILKENIGVKQEQLKLNQDELKTKIYTSGNENLSTMYANQKKMLDLQKEIANYQNFINRPTTTQNEKSSFGKSMENDIKKLNELKTISSTAFQELSLGYQSIYQEDQRFKDIGNSGLTLLIKTVTNEVIKMGIHTTATFEDIMNKIGNSDALGIGKSFQNDIKKYKDGLISYQDLWQQQATYVNQFDEALKKAGLTDENVMKAIRDNFLLLPIEETTDKIIDLNTAESSLLSTFKDASAEISDYNQTLYDLANGKKVNLEAIQSLIAKYPALISAIQIENGEMSISAEGLEILKNKRIEEYQTTLMTQAQKTNMVSQSTIARLKAYGLEIQGIQNLANAQTRTAAISTITSKVKDRASGAVANQMVKEIDTFGKYIDFAEKLSNMVGSGNFGLDLGGASGGASPSYSGLEKSIEKYESAFEKIQQEYNETKDLLSRKFDLGIISGLDILDQSLKAEEDKLNKIFYMRSQYQSDLIRWQSELNQLEQTPEDKQNEDYYKAKENILSIVQKITNEISIQGQREQEQLSIVQKLKKEYESIKLPT
ncbi:MAG: phage tail tape measure protein, partial [Clostridia bacterium]